MAYEITCKEYTNYRLYPICPNVCFKSAESYSDYTEFSLQAGKLTFYATNNQLFPLHIYTDRSEENYIASIQFGTGIEPRKRIYNKFTEEEFHLELSECRAFSSNEVICKRGQETIFELYEQKKLFSDNTILLKGTIEGHELELFISLLCFFIKYDENYE